MPKGPLFITLECSWRRVEPDGQQCLACGDIAWMAPLELFMGVKGAEKKPTGCFVCSSCQQEGDFTV
jgi:hypothetical protein